MSEQIRKPEDSLWKRLTRQQLFIPEIGRAHV